MLPLAFTLPLAPLDPPVDLATPERQHTLSATAGVHAFRERWGPWRIRWDERNRTPAALVGPGVGFESAEDLIADIARLAGVDPSDLEQGPTRTAGRRTGTRWHQLRDRVPIQDAGIDVFTLDGRIHYVRAELHRVRLTTEPRANERIAFVATDRGYAYHPVTVDDRGEKVLLRGRDGQAIRTYTRVLDLEMDVRERDPLGADITVPVAFMGVEDSTSAALTDAQGDHGLTAPLLVTLDGPAVRLIDPSGVPLSVTGVDDEHLGDPDLDMGARTVAHHALAARSWLGDLESDHGWLDFVTTAVPSYWTGQCSAQFSNGSIRFSNGLPGSCGPTNEYADIIQHEFGHGVHAAGLLGGEFAVDVSEGSSDYIGATNTGDPIVGRDLYGAGNPLREIDTNRIHPDDFTGQVHQDGRIWSSLLWDLRTDWAVQYPDGIRKTDSLLVAALHYGPAFPDLTEAVLAANDDDGDLSNGTPDDCDLITRLDAHGIGPAGLGLVVFDHVPLGPQGSGLPGYAIDFRLIQATPGCSSFDPDSAEVHWLSGAQGSDLSPSRVGDAYSASIPPVPVGSTVSYWLTWDDAAGNPIRVPDTGEWTFQVGDSTPLWCEGFEAGLGGFTHAAGLPGETVDPSWSTEWEIGSPTGNFPNPTGPFAGSQILATRLDGPYSHDNHQHARSPMVDLSVPGSATLLRLETRRFASFESGAWDQATVTALPAGEVLWENPADTDLFDPGWVPFTVDLRAHAGTSVELAFTLSSDAGVSFGGWNLDEVCVVALDAPEAHYAVTDLAASDGPGPVTVTWTNPFVVPLAQTVLVRNTTVPTGPSDGEVLEVDPGPTPGAPRSVVTDNPGERFYAVFPTDGAGTTPEAVVGFGADLGGGLGETGDTGGSNDTGTPVDTGEADTDTDADSDTDADTDTDADSDTDADTDADTDTDADADADADADTDPATETDQETDVMADDRKCGCNGGVSPVLLPSLLALLGLRRRTPW